MKKSRGALRIFFGYARGVGVTGAMLLAAREASARGVDTVVGWIAPHSRPDTVALLEGLEVLPRREGEFDLDGAIRRAPALVVLDDLAHENGEGSRHQRRFQDVEELLKAGVDVYTTLTVQHIESLTDTVASILGQTVPDPIPDSVFDRADRVKLVDLEPEELVERLGEGRDRLKDLSALRELALRRCADKLRTCGPDRGRQAEDYRTEEHILVCLSSSPSNARIIRTAARMANAFKGTFTGLFVETPDFPAMSQENRKRLRDNMRLAEQLGAKIETVYGADVPFQIAEFARLSGVSKVVIGRSAATKAGFWSQQTLSEKLIAHAPQLDIHIIPDSNTEAAPYRPERLRKYRAVWSPADLIKTVAILLLATLVGEAFDHMGFEEANIITVYVLGVLITSVITTSRVYSLVSSLVSVLVFNFLFTAPRFTFHAYEKGYSVTFVVMFTAALLTGSLAVKLKSHAKQSAQVAYRTKLLLDINQALQQARGREEIVKVIAGQLIKLLQNDVVFYTVENGELGEAQVFPAGPDSHPERYDTPGEREVAQWVLVNNKHAGATTQTLSHARCLYLAVRVNQNVYGVIGLAVGQQPLDAFGKSILLSILGECALALENEKNAREKEEAAILAKNEQLRANLLRSISHDLRTPLTSISGNASNFLSNGDSMDEDMKRQLFIDIYDDSMWLINLVENLLSVTRLEENRLNLHLTSELAADVVEEALRHVNRRSVEYHITVTHQDELLLAWMDPKLMVQVVINLVDNAIKYTPPGSNIWVETRQEGSWAVFTVADDGPGIPDEAKPRIFDMFYSEANRVADSRRSLGLGLCLCRSIINAHGGTIEITDHVPHGACFTFTLPIGEVDIHE